MGGWGPFSRWQWGHWILIFRTTKEHTRGNIFDDLGHRLVHSWHYCALLGARLGNTAAVLLDNPRRKHVKLLLNRALPDVPLKETPRGLNDCIRGLRHKHTSYLLHRPRLNAPLWNPFGDLHNTVR